MFSEEQIGYKLNRIRDYNINSVLFEGETVLGYPDHLDVTVIKLKQLDKNISFIEFNPQQGMTELAGQLNHKILKTHVLDIPVKSSRKVVNRALRAVIERSCRIIQIKPYIDEESEDIYQFNLQIVKDIKENLTSKGYNVQIIKNNPFAKYKISSLKYFAYVLSLIIIGVFIRQFTNKFKTMHK